MAKKTKRELWDRERQVWYYKWEFLRRNEEFKADFEPLQKFIVNSKWRYLGVNPAVNRPSKKQLGEMVKKVFGSVKKFTKYLQLYFDLCRKWDMPGFIDPSIDLETYVLYFTDPGPELEHLMSYAIFVICGVVQSAKETYVGKASFLPVVLSIPKIHKHRTSGSDLIDLSINLKFPKAAIMAFLEFYVDLYKRDYASKLDKATRARLREYKDYLRIYDLKQQGLNFFDIASDVYKKDIGSIKKDAISIVENTERNYKSCLRLIKGGYKQIR